MTTYKVIMRCNQTISDLTLQIFFIILLYQKIPVQGRSKKIVNRPRIKYAIEIRKKCYQKIVFFVEISETWIFLFIKHSLVLLIL